MLSIRYTRFTASRPIRNWFAAASIRHRRRILPTRDRRRPTAARRIERSAGQRSGLTLASRRQAERQGQASAAPRPAPDTPRRRATTAQADVPNYPRGRPPESNVIYPYRLSPIIPHRGENHRLSTGSGQVHYYHSARAK